MKRREFLASGMGLTAGYSLVVRAQGAPVSPEPPVAEDVRAAFDRIAPKSVLYDANAEPHMARVALDCDVFIAGGGLAGVCAAVSAARHGCKVVLAQDRSRLGGNSSSEVKMHVVGANSHKGRPGWREGGLLEEIRLDDAVNNPQRCWELWDLLLYDKCVSEPNITLLLDSPLFAVSMKEGRIDRAYVRSDKTEHLYSVGARIYMDCTGDSRLGLEAGAEMRYGREARSDYKESLAPEVPDKETLGSSILFTSKNYGKPMPFTPPKWARKVTKEMVAKRPTGSWEYGYWWIEWGGELSTIRDNERIRFELLAIVRGVWDYIKNSGNHPDSAHWALDWVGMMPGKRESRRLVGD
ncbi:MAG: FAD-dependent oxidoreductase, partial [Isosphaeraceae bacterium]